MSPLYDAVILAVPAVEASKVEVHVAVPAAVPAARVQLGKVPVTPDTAKATDPVGVVGDDDVSVTIAVHDVVWPTTTVVAVHDTMVDVGWPVTVTVTVVVPLPAACAASPP